MKILNHTITITKVPHADKPKTKIYKWQIVLKHSKTNSFDYLSGYSTTMNGATNDASIVLYNKIKKDNLL